MDFKDYLEKTARDLDREVEKILGQQLKEIEKIDEKLVPLASAFIKACRGGKRIRGVLVMLGYEIANKESKEILKIGAAYEIFHSAILAHDDIIDQSTTRRGQPSLYQALGGEHRGISQAISLGDLGFFLAIKIISESNFPAEEKNQAMEWFSKVMIDTSLGEMLDVEKGDVLEVMKLKTAAYTITGPLQLGAMLGGWGPTSPRLRGVKEFGENLGIAFQIQDDILDQDVSLIEENGIDYAKKEANKYKNQAMKILPNITKDKRMSKLLEQMAEYLVERTK